MPITGNVLWERMDRAVENVQQRLMRTVAALDAAGVPYAVSGGMPCALGRAGGRSGRADHSRRGHPVAANRLGGCASSLGADGLRVSPRGRRRHVSGRPGAKARDAVHLVFAAEKVRDEYLWPAPDVTESAEFGEFRVLTLEALVRMKLTSFRRKDQMHLLDMIDVELIDPTWPARFPPELGTRLQELLDNPEG